jgi:Na+/phosphate symporter
MAERSPGRSIAATLRWGLGLLLLGYFAFDAMHPEETESTRVEEPVAATNPGLSVVRLKPVEVPPGGATVVSLAGIDERDPTPITASIDKQPVEVIYRHGREIVVRLPDSQQGHRRLRVQQGERHSKGYDLWVKPVARRKVVYGLIGGVALFVLGLRTLQQGLRAYAGGRLKGAVAHFSGSLPRGLGLGVLAGALTQSSASSAGVLVSFVESDLLGLAPALSMLLGAQLGAALTVLALPLGSAREGLLVVALGVAWLGLSADRRSGAMGSMLLGVGLLQYGVQLLRSGLAPLVSDPALLPYVNDFASTGVRGLMVSSAAGVLVTALTQGPGALFALTLGLAQSSGLIGVREALAILSGAAFGGALGSAVVVWPFGRKARRMALGHLALGGAVTLALLCSLPAWTALAAALPSSAGDALGHAKNMLSPHVGMRLAVSFVASQLAVTLIALPLMPALARSLSRRPRTSVRSGSRSGVSAEQGAHRLGTALDQCGHALAAIAALTTTRERTHASDADAALRAGRGALDELLGDLATSGAAAQPLAAVAVALSQLHETIASLARLGERGIEEGVEPDSEDLTALGALHARVGAALDAFRRTLVEGSAGALEGARVLEIRINAEEGEHRRRLTERLADADTAAVARRVHVTSMLAAYETVGNYLFRAHEALAGELD